ncbi:DNA-3-methyladenine glycosylase 2 family protein [Microbacterium sp. STN6]|uniref:DNA-3-methyladenine glycosylase family protein n=1 Tax=Microbacterium sp. STN6 TaxID=2995588 RepID=UPI002260C176|nr:DNA-3-methyladenine glycosylase 2 family protein [Microbacterium sp. STN6]MCX7522615.1 DNA-3-methyladenine glycosylase 2 family protein [Microbacterium sp. STN6]
MVAEATRAPLRTAYRPRHPLDVRATLAPLGRGPHDPTTQWDAAGVWRTFRTPTGPATLRITQHGDGADALAWGPGAEWAIEAVPSLLGAGDDWSQLDVAAHPVLREARRRNPGMRLARTGRVLEALVPAIIEQKITSVEAFRSWAWLVRRYGEAAPGPATAGPPSRSTAGLPTGLRVMPSPQTWRRVPSWEWHRAGVDPRRSRAALEACHAASALEKTTDAALTAAHAARRLRSLPGIGVWTAAETMQRSHGDPDAVSVGDYHLAAFVGQALIGRRVDDDGMLELLESWAGQRQRVVRLLGASGFRGERRGPRMTIQDHRWH